MPLTAANVIEPAGRIAPDLLGDTTITTTWVGAYLTQGYALADAAAVPPAGTERDDAARQYAYHRAWLAKYDQENDKAASVHVAGAGDVSRSKLAAQIAAWKALADEALDAFVAIVPPEAPASALPEPLPPSSRVTSALTAW